MADQDDYWFFQSQTAPAFLAQAQGEAWWLVWGHAKDAWREGAREATKATLPSLAAPDALGAYAAERGTERYPTETEADYRTRLAETFDRYLLLGTPTGVTEAVDATPGILDVLYREAWQWESGSAEWARFWLVLTTAYDPPISWGASGRTFGDDPDTLFGVVTDHTNLEFLRRQIARWKAAHAKFVWCAIKIGDAHVFGEPGPEWGDPGMTFGAGAVALLES